MVASASWTLQISILQLLAGYTTGNRQQPQQPKLQIADGYQAQARTLYISINFNIKDQS
jgi:hypothetical protein